MVFAFLLGLSRLPWRFMGSYKWGYSEVTVLITYIRGHIPTYSYP